MEYAHKAKELQLGKYYLVAHVKIKIDNHNEIFSVPVIPHKHVDEAFFNREHYHIDGRFLKDKPIIKAFEVSKNGKTNLVIVTDGFVAWYDLLPGVFYLKRKCLHVAGGLNLPVFYECATHVPIVAWMHSMKGKSCKGGKCPHYGIQMNLVDGKYICPAHNLIGCPVKEIII